MLNQASRAAHQSKTGKIEHLQRKGKPASSKLIADSLPDLDRIVRSGSGSLSPGQVLALQRSAGNQAVSALLRHAVQPRLTVGPAGDAYEQEADRVADKVMTDIHQEREIEHQTMNDPGFAPGEAPLRGNIQRMAVPAAGEITRLAQREANPGDALLEGGETSPAFERALTSQAGSGKPLSGDIRQAMEPRFGVDFSGVRLHSGSESSHLNRQIGSQAFTHGQNIYLGDGKDNLASPEGQRLLAHELTHVVQQGGAAPSVQRLVSRADFVRLSGEAGKMAAHNKSTYWRILKALDDYPKTAPKDKKMVLYKLGRDINSWLDKHREHKAASKEPGAEIEEYASDKADQRKEEYLLLLKEEVKAEYSGKPTEEETPSSIIGELNQAAREGDEHVKSIKQAGLPKNDKYSLTVVAAIENKDYLDFARKRLKITIAQKFKPFGKLSNTQIKQEAARQVVAEKYKDLEDEERLQKIEELADAGGEVGHTWVILKHNSTTGQKIAEDSYGFWPLAGFRNPTMPVPGSIVSPDTQHAKDPEQRRIDFEVTPEQYVKGLDKAVSTMKSPPEYKLIDYNCTKFARDIALTMGVSFPENAYLTVPSASMKAWNPNALYEEMNKIEGSYSPVEQEKQEAVDRDERFNRLRPQLAGLKLTVYSDDFERTAMNFDGEDFYWYYKKNHKTDYFRVSMENDKEVTLIDQNRIFLVAPREPYYTWTAKVLDVIKQINGGTL